MVNRKETWCHLSSSIDRGLESGGSKKRTGDISVSAQEVPGVQEGGNGRVFGGCLGVFLRERLLVLALEGLNIGSQTGLSRH